MIHEYVTVPLTHEDSALPLFQYAVPHDVYAVQVSGWSERSVVPIDDNTQFEKVELNSEGGSYLHTVLYVR